MDKEIVKQYIYDNKTFQIHKHNDNVYKVVHKDSKGYVGNHTSAIGYGATTNYAMVYVSGVYGTVYKTFENALQHICRVLINSEDRKSEERHNDYLMRDFIFRLEDV